MHLKLPFLAFVLIVVGLVLSGAAYMRFTVNPIQQEQESYEREPIETEAKSPEEVSTEEQSTNASTGTKTNTPPATEEKSGYTMTDVRAHASASSCWTVVNGSVYDLTAWISRHPGGKGAIMGMCGKDGTSAFLSEHNGDLKAESRLAGFLLGPLTK